MTQLEHRPCVFLDRDGVLNVDRGYTFRVEDLEWMPGAIHAVRAINNAGYRAIVITNQAGIARGLYSEEDMHGFHNEMQRRLRAAGARLDAFYFCPFHAEATDVRYRVADHPDRKPRPGMILRAIRDWNIRAGGSFVVGDKATDMEAAAGANLPGVLFERGDLAELVLQHLSSPPHIV